MHRELAKRSHDGIVVRLIWDDVEDRVLIRYRDERIGDSFVAEIPRSKALAAFEHPNAYRPSRVPAAV